MEALERRPSVNVLPSGLLSRKDAAAFLGREPKTLAQWKSRGVGPRPRLVGGRAYYDLEELRAFAQIEPAE